MGADKTSRRLRVALVIQRYGEGLGGGAETHCRLVAQHLADWWDVTILTTCARDYRTWENHYPPGHSQDGALRVIRFPVRRPRDYRRFDRISHSVLDGPHGEAEEREWFELQGPDVPELLDFLRSCRDDYDVFIFFTYLYATTVFGLPLVADKAWLVPTAHDEKPIYLTTFDRLFSLPRAILYNTEAERAFCCRRFSRRPALEAVIGCGVSISSGMTADEFRRRHGLEGRFVLYVGRIARAKACDELIDMYQSLARSDATWPPLVLAGSTGMKVTKRTHVRLLGYLDEPAKSAAMEAASVLIQPSYHESLSLVLLESWLCGTPALVNGRCQVLRDQVVRAGGRLYYTCSAELAEALTFLLSRPQVASQMAQAGRSFVEANYAWDAIRQKYQGLAKQCGLVR